MTNELHNILKPSAPSLQVLVVYDNLISAIKVKDLCDRLAHGFRLNNPLILSFWSVSALRSPLLAQTAADESTETDLLIVAVNGANLLPTSIRRWIRGSARRLKSRGGAFVAQFQSALGANCEALPAGDCLQPIGGL
jgi:hypothetical protein